jgi:hypothetical protein
MVIALAIVSALLAISEALAFIPSVKANGIFEAIVNILISMKDFLSKN